MGASGDDLRAARGRLLIDIFFFQDMPRSHLMCKHLMSLSKRFPARQFEEALIPIKTLQRGNNAKECANFSIVPQLTYQPTTPLH